MVWIDSDILLIGFNKQWPLWREVSSIPSSSSLSSFGLHRPWGHRATVCRFESRSYKRQTLRHLRQTQREGDHFAMFTVQSVHKWQILTNSHLSTSVFKKTIHNVSLCVCVSVLSCHANYQIDYPLHCLLHVSCTERCPAKHGMELLRQKSVTDTHGQRRNKRGTTFQTGF